MEDCAMTHPPATRKTGIRIVVFLLFFLAATGTRAYQQAVKLYPIIYLAETADGVDCEALLSLIGHHRHGDRDSNRVFPVFWGNDFFHIAPLFWSWENNWVLLPIGGKVGDGRAVGLVWWGPDVQVVFPFFYRAGENWLLPGA